MVMNINESLPPESRTSENWEYFTKFGEESDKPYTVHVDIAACYEYIDHARLLDELLVRTMDIPVSKPLVNILTELMGGVKGLPQMQWASDRLADTYLDILIRSLERRKLETSRYVDDIKVGADNWDEALRLVELIADEAHELGLALSAEKTRILKKKTLVEQREAESEVLGRYFRSAMDSAVNSQVSQQVLFEFAGPYGEFTEPDEQEPDQAEGAAKFGPEVVGEAVWTLFHDWYVQAVWDLPETTPNDTSVLRQHMSWTLPLLYDYRHRLPDDLLAQWAFHDPSAMRSICRYVLQRAASGNEDSWSTLVALTERVRRSPWSSLWLLYSAGKLASPSLENDSAKKMAAWTLAQLDDRHELVRAEAAWTLACFALFDSAAITDLYREATPLTQHALAAAFARQKKGEKAIYRALKDDGPLNRKAMKWAEEHSEEAK
jgi:hypothetical protein